MAITKSDHQLEAVRFLFDEHGDASGATVTVNFAIRDGDVEITRARVEQDVWSSLTPEERDTVNQAARVLRDAAGQS